MRTIIIIIIVSNIDITLTSLLERSESATFARIVRALSPRGPGSSSWVLLAITYFVLFVFLLIVVYK